MKFYEGTGKNYFKTMENFLYCFYIWHFYSSRIVNTAYEVAMGENVACRLLCHGPKDPINWGEEDSQRVIERIQHEYSVHL